MNVIVLHLSDIHIQGATDPVLSKSSAIASAVFPAARLADLVLIVVSGDIASTGKHDEYVHAKKFLLEICRRISDEVSKPVHIVTAPGNHDCDFDLDDEVRRIVMDRLATSAAKIADDSVIDSCTGIQKPYFKFRDDIETIAAVRSTSDNLWRTSTFCINEKTICLHALNISWSSRIKEVPGTLSFPVERYEESSSEQADLKLVVMHHPLNWMSQASYRPLRYRIRSIAHVVITGHEHLGNVGLNSDSETGESLFVEGCALQETSSGVAESAFNVISFDLDRGRYISKRFSLKDDLYLEADIGSWADYRDIPAKRSARLEISKDFAAQIDDAGAYFCQQDRRTLSLSDVYVFPDLKETTGDGKGQVRVNADTLLDSKRIAGISVIEGDEKSGRTSLLYQLVRKYHDKSYVPVFLNGRDLKKATDAEVDRAIRMAVEFEYGPGSSARVDQIDLTPAFSTAWR